MHKIHIEESSDVEKQFTRLYNKAFMYQSRNLTKLAITHYQQALRYKPKHLPTLQILAYLLQQSEDYKLAINYYHRALAQHPHSHSMQLAIASCFEKIEELDQAMLHYEHALEIRQDYAVALNNYGNVCRKLGLLEQAEEYLLKALRLKISVETLANLGLLMVEKRQYTLAESFYDHALRLEPDNLQVKWNKALLYLSQKKFKQGWELYDVGLLASTRPRQVSPIVSSTSEYTLDFFKNKNVYIHSEQGIGDEIMFASCYQEIIAVANQCIIECDDRLAPLFQRSFREASIITKSEAVFKSNGSSATSVDCYISAASVPRFLRQNANAFPMETSYLKPYSQAVDLWKKRYKNIGAGLKIGISWRGGSNEETRKRSSNLEQWENVLTLSGCHFVNLQYGNVDLELKDSLVKLHEWPDTDHFHNIEQLAAQIASLDLVITVSNVTAHLAGALGIPVWIMLPHSPNWRWFEGNNPSPWYQSARLFRQTSPGDWNSVIQAIETELLMKITQEKQPMQQADVVF